VWSVSVCARQGACAASVLGVGECSA
jgi:hypothetical protein